MKTSFKVASAAVLSILGFAMAAPAASAPDWPNRPVNLVVPFPPGGGTDVLGRMLAGHIEDQLNQTVVIDNRPGAAGNVGAAYVSRSEPDGYTFLLQGTVIGLYPHIYADLAYDPIEGLAPITTIAETPNIIVVSPESPLQSFPELMEAANDASKPLTFATAGTGSPQHMGMEMLSERAGLETQGRLEKPHRQSMLVQ